jgi:hypothetical protein
VLLLVGESGGPHFRSGRGDKDKNLVPAGNRTPVISFYWVECPNQVQLGVKKI